MCACLVEVFHVRQQHVPKVPLPKHNDMVNAFPPDRTDQPFGISILPRRSRRSRSISDAHRANTPSEYLAIGTIPVVDEVLWSPLPAACLSELVGDPLGGGVRGGPQPRSWRRISKPYRSRNEIVGTTKRSIATIPSA